MALHAAEGPGTVVIDATGADRPVVACRDGSVTLQNFTLRSDGPTVTVDASTLHLEGCHVQPGYGAGDHRT